jgi:hypothetical protein
MMNKDTAGRVHWQLYGKSDKLNAPCNKNVEFRSGYCKGVETYGHKAEVIIVDEYALRQEAGDALDCNFEEWKRGFWAARSQLAGAGIKRRKKSQH